MISGTAVDWRRWPAADPSRPAPFTQALPDRVPRVTLGSGESFSEAEENVIGRQPRAGDAQASASCACG